MSMKSLPRIVNILAIFLMFYSSTLGSAGKSYAGEQRPSLPTVAQAKPAPEWEAKFAGEKGWIGGDGLYSTLLHSQRVLWWFGDTLWGKVQEGRRDAAAMVNNTIAIQNGRRADAPICFVAGRNQEGKATAFFIPADGKGWFWPQAAVWVDGQLFVFLAQIDKTGDPGVFGFRQIGQWLAKVD